MKTLQLLAFASCMAFASLAAAQSTMYSYAIGNWRNGPTVQISPLFATTGMFTDQQLIAWVKQQWPASFTDVKDIDVLYFATKEEGVQNRITLKAKYGIRKLPVHMIEAETMPRTPDKPAKKPAAAPR